MSYTLSVATKKDFLPNVVIFFKGKYWGQRQPDSGLVIDADCLGVEQVAINPTKIDPFKANTTINSYTFKLVDHNFAVTLLFNGITSFFQGEKVEIYIGRCNEDMPFADYFKLPDTFVKSVSRDKNSYNFKTSEAKDRLNRPAFNKRNKLEVNILSGTDIIDAVTPILPDFPTSGLFKIEDEYISYSGIDIDNNRFTGCIRGEKLSVPVDHKEGEDIFLVVDVVGNPIDILLQCLVSQGGGSAYDVLPDGAGLDQNLVAITRFEEIRDEFFTGVIYSLSLYGITNILQFLENEILFPNEIRFVTDSTSKLSCAILNRQVFDDEMPVIDNSTIQKQPKYTVDDTEIINQVNIEYDYLEGTNIFKGLLILKDDESITTFGIRNPLEIQLKGVKTIYNGAQICTDIAQRFLSRFSVPRPEIEFSTLMDKSLVNLADKVELASNQIPSDTGELNFASTVEILERGINYKTGDVTFKIGFTSFTGIRQCFLAPSDTALTFANQKTVNIGAGRGALYRAGWMMRLYDNSARNYASSQDNEIESVVDDTITFKDNWSTTLINEQFRIMFSDYDVVAFSQKRYCFISDDGNNFDDGRKTFQISI